MSSRKGNQTGDSELSKAEEEPFIKDSEDPFDLDELLPEIGEFGRYQQLLLFGICLPACIPCGFVAFNQLFMTDVPEDYWCSIPEMENYTSTDWRSIALPLDDFNATSKCLRYAVNWTNILETVNGDLSQVTVNESWPTETCKNGWTFNTTTVNSSIVIDFNLVCDRDIFPTIGLAALNTGGPIGVYLFGIINDRLGRRIAYFTCLATLLVGSFITAISPSFAVWAFSRAIVGLTIPAVYQIPFIIALELVGPGYRSFVTVMTCTFYTFGIMMLAGVSYLIRDWVELSLYTSVPFLLYFLYILIMPESPRWLLARGKLEEALKVLEVMARVNKKQLPMAFRDRLEARVRTNKKQKTKSIGAFDLCKTPNMRLKTILITLNWFVNETVYLGLCYYGPSLGTNQYLSFFLSCLVEVPSYFVCWLIMEKFGRRWPMCMLMIMGGISCVVTVLLPDDAVTETLILFLVSKTFLSGSFLIIYPFAGEIYPTQVRGVGIGTSSYIGGLGLIGIPFVTYLGRENLRLPLVIMGSVAALGGFTGLRIPETLNQRLPQTLEEGEEFGKDWTMADCLVCKPIERNDSTSQIYTNMDEPVTSKLTPVIELDSLIPLRANERTPLELTKRHSMRRLVRQASTMDTQKVDGAMQLTYWF